MGPIKLRNTFAGLLIAVILMPLIVMAAQPMNIQVMGLFRDKASVKINGKQELLKLGEPSASGVVLIRSNSKRAILEVNGVQKSYGLGSQVSTKLSKPLKSIVRIPSIRGMYLTQGFINGRNVSFVVDTGASQVAMSRVTADRLQIRYRETGIPSTVSTAAALKKAWRVKLDSVTVGGITLQQVDGTVIDSAHDQEILLGMSFLGRVKLTQESGMVVLEAEAR